MKIRTILVDDEPLARNKLKLFLADEPDFEIVRECTNGKDAIAALNKHRADVLFLDIQMPEVDGFEVVESVSPDRLPYVVFVTAHDAFAVRAFQIHALDYLLKPFDRERLKQSLARVRKALQQTTIERQHNQILSLLNDLKSRQERPRRLLLKSAGRVYFVNVQEIDWVESEGNYLRLHVGNESHLMRQTMNTLERLLSPSQFIRIHRSTLVNIERVKELQPWFGGEYLAILQGGKKLNVGKSYRKKLTDTFAQHL
jgi:two-component system LytT family response regulator